LILYDERVNKRATRFRTRWAKRLLLSGLAIAALAFVVHAVPIEDRCIDSVQAHCKHGLWTTLARANVGLVVLCCALSFGATFVWAWRWLALVRLARIDVTLLHAWRVTLESMAASIILPGGVGGDALRIGAMVGRGAPVATVAASVLLDRMSGLVMLALVAAVLSFAFGGADARLLSLSMGAVPIAYAVGLALIRTPTLAWQRVLSPGILSKVIQPILAYVRDPSAPRSIAKSLLGSLATSVLQLTIVRILLHALGVAPTAERWVYVGFALSQVVLAIPAAPGGWGTGEVAYVVFLGRAGIPPATALAVSLLMRVFSYVSAGIGAVLFVLHGWRSNSAASAAESAPP
jgi:uncharacterized membrane protein YbhN (UPF0104 family)